MRKYNGKNIIVWREYTKRPGCACGSGENRCDVTAVNRRDYGQKIGTLAEISGFHKNGKIYNGPDFAMEMLVFSGMDSQQVDAFLAEYKATGLPPVALKAIVTPYNVSWTADALLRELMKEHIQLGG